MSDWRTATLDELVKLQRGHDLPTAQRRSGNVPVVGAAGPSGVHDTAIVKAPGVVVGRAGASMGHATFCEVDFWPLNTSLYATDFLGNNPRFVYYLLDQIDFSGYNSGAAQPVLNRNYIKQIQISLPEPSEQRAIVDVLGALDDKIAVNGRIAAVSLELARASYISSSPSEQQTIGSLAQVFDGPHATPQKVADGPWFLSISSLQGGLLELSESAHISEEDFPRWTRRVQPAAGDVLFSYETRIGEAALMPSNIQACLGRRMALLRTMNPEVSGALLLHAFLGNFFQQEIKQRTIHGATVDRIPLRELPMWPILLPSASIRGALSSALSSLHLTIEQTERESQALATLRDTLLPQLMSGRLRVKDAEKIVENHV